MKMDNNYLFLIFVIVVGSIVFLSQCTYNETTINYNYYPVVKTDLSPEESEFVRLINEHRINLGLNPLIAEVLASEVCEIRNIEDEENNTYPSHLHWEKLVRDAKCNPDYASHIYAQNFVNVFEMFQAYLNSPKHRSAIENPNRTHIGTSYINKMNHTLIVKY